MLLMGMYIYSCQYSQTPCAGSITVSFEEVVTFCFRKCHTDGDWNQKG